MNTGSTRSNLTRINKISNNPFMYIIIWLLLLIKIIIIIAIIVTFSRPFWLCILPNLMTLHQLGASLIETERALLDYYWSNWTTFFHSSNQSRSYLVWHLTISLVINTRVYKRTYARTHTLSPRFLLFGFLTNVFLHTSKNINVDI